MNRGRHNLDDLLKVAHSEEPVVSTQEIDGLLDAYDLHGRRSTDAQSILADLQPRTPKRRRILMGTLAFILLGTVLGTGALIWDDAPTTTNTAPAGDRAPIAVAERIEKESTPQPLADVAPSQHALPTTAAFTPTSMVVTNNDITNRPPLRQGDDEKPTISVEVDEIEVDIDEDLSKLLEQVVGGYWETKINSYKQYVDRVISSDDKQELDRLRVRWELAEKGDGMFGQMAFNMADVNTQTDESFIHLEDGDAEMVTNNKIQTANVSVSVTNNGEGTNQQIIVNGRTVKLDGIDPTTFDRSELDSLIGDKNVSVSVTVKDGEKPIELELDASDLDGTKAIVIHRDGDQLINDSNIVINKKMIIRNDGEGETQELNFGEESDEGIDEMGMIGSLAPMLKMMIKMDPSESSQIMVTTWGIAERNREELDGLKATIMNDLKEFGNVVAATMKEYAAANSEKMPDGFQEQIADKSSRIDEMLEDGPVAEVIGSLYETLAEPMILLYNGSDISPVLTSAILQPVTGQAMTTSSRLKQSFPNPASDEATIAFELDEPSAATTLRLFDATGSEVRHLDLGALPTGANSTTLNVADLAAGAYLYHLTISTGNGEQVFSKKMEIAR